MTSQHHHWVKHTVTKVSVIPDLDEEDKVTAIEDPEDVQAAEDGALYGCDVCGVLLEGNADTMCEGPPSEIP